MASTNPANIINYSKADFNFVRREKTHPGYFSGYKKFFRGTKWHVFAGPAHSLEDSLTESRRYKVNEGLWEVPAVYEFAVAKTPNGKRFKTYIGTPRTSRTAMATTSAMAITLLTLCQLRWRADCLSCGACDTSSPALIFQTTRLSSRLLLPSRPRLDSLESSIMLGVSVRMATRQ
ncbi:hypothetical protein PBCVCVM1_455L [Paramecium bursaria Chlorella virus CVM-1]|nr:hypothetical protein PBCVCVM1_455L [Paramecium bursaria Chlorella virus CVM-1]